MGNCCCCFQCHASDVSHSDNEDIVQEHKEISDSEVDTSVKSTTYKRSDYWSRFLSDGSVNLSLFSFDSDTATDCRCVSEFCVDDPLDLRPCHVTGMTCLPDGSTVMIDARNKKIKVFTKDFEFAYVQKARGGIRDVEYVGQNEIAVTEGRHICFYRIENRYITKQVKKFTLGGRLGGLSYNGFWYAAYCADKSHAHIKILDSDGEETFDIDLSTIISPVKRSRESIALDNSEDSVHVTDTGNRRVCCLDFNGIVLWHTSSDVFGTPICLVALDHVIVCADWSKSKVFKISPDGSQVVPAISKGLRKPSFMAFQLMQNRLIVYANSRRLVQVFQLRVHETECVQSSNEHRKLDTSCSYQN